MLMKDTGNRVFNDDEDNDYLYLSLTLLLNERYR